MSLAAEDPDDEDMNRTGAAEDSEEADGEDMSRTGATEERAIPDEAAPKDDAAPKDGVPSPADPSRTLPSADDDCIRRPYCVLSPLVGVPAITVQTANDSSAAAVPQPSLFADTETYLRMARASRKSTIPADTTQHPAKTQC